MMSLRRKRKFVALDKVFPKRESGDEEWVGEIRQMGIDNGLYQ
jgi:hypothetical protein